MTSITCSRCASLMVPTAPLQFYSSGEDQSEGAFGASYRCVCCGNYEDQTILLNRAKQAQEGRLIDQANVIATWAEFQSRQAA